MTAQRRCQTATRMRADRPDTSRPIAGLQSLTTHVGSSCRSRRSGFGMPTKPAAEREVNGRAQSSTTAR